VVYGADAEFYTYQLTSHGSSHTVMAMLFREEGQCPQKVGFLN